MAREDSRVLVVGYNAFDVTVPAPGRAEPDSKIEVGEIRLGGGGPAATAAVALARLGASVRLVTPLTDDAPGRMQRAELESAGVDLSLCPRVEGESPRAVILVDVPRGERTIYWSRGGLPLLDPEVLDDAWLDAADLLYCDGHECPAATRLARAARERGVPVVMDAGTPRDGSTALVAACTDVISSEIFAPRLTGLDDPTAALAALVALGPERVAMTFGVDGVLGLDQGSPFLVPAFDVEVVDTTGAGDAFHAGYAFARMQGEGLAVCLEYGAAVAACKCRGWGGRTALPDRAATEALIRGGARRAPGTVLAGFPVRTAEKS